MACWLGLTIAQWVWGASSSWLWLPLLVLSAPAAFLVAVITHNSVHVPVFHAPPLERLFRMVLTLGYGHPVSAFVPGHNLSHHRYMESSRDVIRTSKVAFRWNLLNLLLFFFVIGGGVMREELRFIRAAFARDRPWVKQLLIEAAVWLGTSGALLFIDARRFALCFVLPSFYASWGILSMNLLQHDGCDATSRYDHSRNFVGKLVNYFTFNNGYHGVHHLDPHIHWSELPARHAELVAPHVHPSLMQPSLLAYLWQSYGWPGRRLRFDGTPLTVRSAERDEDWIDTKTANLTKG